MRAITAMTILSLLPGGIFQARAADLHVGPGQRFAQPGEALKAAQPGDTIIVHPLPDHGAYRSVALQIKTPRLTLRSADDQTPVCFDGQDFDYSGKGPVPRAIIQFNPGADGCTVDGFELIHARNDSFNGAGIRINQANDITVRHCLIHHDDMGIMSNGALADQSGRNQLIEFCQIHTNGSDQHPGQSHNLYLGGTSVTVRGCEIFGSTTGHNLKSRAHVNWIEYNYLHDSANRELDLVDAKGTTDAPGSDTVLLGNFIVKERNTRGNKNVIHFGQDGGNDHTGTLWLVHNTIVTPYQTSILDLSAPGTIASVFNNLFVDAQPNQKGKTIASARGGADLKHVTGQGNRLQGSFALPTGVQTGDPVPLNQIQLPWPGAKAQALQEWVAFGKVLPRSSASAGAGSHVKIGD